MECPKECPPLSKVFSVFYANITSLSPHATNYIFSLPKHINLFAGVELHKHDTLEVENLFRFHGFKSSYNPAEKLHTLYHGGEIVAARASLNSRPVNPYIYQTIVESLNSTIRFTSRIVVFKQLELLCITIYLWDSEGFTDRNITLLRQLKMLIDLVGLPWFCVGDFNITFEQFRDSQWPDYLKCKMIHPNMKSTTSQSNDRVIDFAICDSGIHMLINSPKPIYSVPWGPHWATVFLFVLALNQ